MKYCSRSLCRDPEIIEKVKSNMNNLINYQRCYEGPCCFDCPKYDECKDEDSKCSFYGERYWIMAGYGPDDININWCAYQQDCESKPDTKHPGTYTEFIK